MSDFIDEAFDKDTIAVQAKMEEKKAYLYVEGLDDVDFWKELLQDDKIDISSTSREEKQKSHKGKNALRELVKKSNKKLIIAIDSDFDFLCPNNSQSAIEFNRCKYVIQTYFYSKENISLQPNIIDLILEKTKLNNEKISSDFKSYIEKYSQIIYQCFIRFLFLRNEKIKTLNSKKFHSALTPKNPIFDTSFDIRNDPFSQVKINASNIEKDLDNEIKKIPGWDVKLNDFIAVTEEKGLLVNTAHCFINGHRLEDSIVTPYTEGKIRALKIKLTMKIKEECKSDKKQISNRRNEISNIISKKHSFHTRLRDCNEIYKHDIIKEIKNNFLKAIN